MSEVLKPWKRWEGKIKEGGREFINFFGKERGIIKSDDPISPWREKGFSEAGHFIFQPNPEKVISIFKHLRRLSIFSPSSILIKVKNTVKDERS